VTLLRGALGAASPGVELIDQVFKKLNRTIENAEKPDICQ
jgi:hypothetical protein